MRYNHKRGCDCKNGAYGEKNHIFRLTRAMYLYRALTSEHNSKIWPEYLTYQGSYIDLKSKCIIVLISQKLRTVVSS